MLEMINAPHEKQTGVAVDGKPLQKGVDCEISEGSTIVTLKPAFLATLKDRMHTLEVYFTDGRMRTQFTTPLSASLTTAAVPGVPATGDAPFGISSLLSKLFFGGKDSYKAINRAPALSF